MSVTIEPTNVIWDFKGFDDGYTFKEDNNWRRLSLMNSSACEYAYQNNIEEVKNALDLFNNSTYSTTIINRIPLQGEFKPHNMYDPVRGEVYFASSQTLHRKYSALGYTHINPNINIESANPLPVQTGTELPQSDSSFSGGTGSGSSGGDSGGGGGGYGGGY